MWLWQLCSCELDCRSPCYLDDHFPKIRTLTHVTRQVQVTETSEIVEIPVWSNKASEKPTPVICSTPSNSLREAKARRLSPNVEEYFVFGGLVSPDREGDFGSRS
jgi:hypothetical protein